MGLASTESANMFSRYREYTELLHDLAREASESDEWNAGVTAALDGQAASELRRLVDLESRRKFGAFFTGSALADTLLSLNRASICSMDNVFFDPAVGAGDLLIAAARRMPLESTFEGTLTVWGGKLAGTDIHAEFIKAAKIRLVLLARQRHGYLGSLPPNWKRAFPLIRLGDGLRPNRSIKQASHVLMNPPFGFVNCPEDYSWAGGRVSEAAVFVISALESMAASSELFAILPEVLRSGSFYHHWRKRVCELAEVHSIKSYGTFDESADVDVFTLHLVRRGLSAHANAKLWPEATTPNCHTIADFFNVHVGRVVPHRDPESGPLYPFLHARGVPVWVEMNQFPETRRFGGLTYQPPFVVIRRTSRPGHPYRAAATLILGKERVAVENHLIVCLPKKRSVALCRALIQSLRSESTNEFLNQRIRCRHLTVSSVKEIPFDYRASSIVSDRQIVAAS